MSWPRVMTSTLVFAGEKTPDLRSNVRTYADVMNEAKLQAQEVCFGVSFVTVMKGGFFKALTYLDYIRSEKTLCKILLRNLNCQQKANFSYNTLKSNVPFRFIESVQSTDARESEGGFFEIS